MPTRRLRSVRPISPWRVFALSLLVAFVIEGAIMLILPRVRWWPEGSPWDSVVDAASLAVAFAPTLWFLAVRPLRDLSRDRGELLGRVMAAQDDERQRLARDLHDELGQHLTALLVGLRGLEKVITTEETRQRVEGLNRVAAAGLEEVRRLARGLAPAVLDDFGLSVAVRRLCEDFHAAHGIEVACGDELEPRTRFERAVETTAYRLVQESLTNIARHAQARRVSIMVRHSDGRLLLEVRDDGKGFDATGSDPTRRGLGLRSIEERARWLGGEATVTSRAGEGTIVRAWLPASPAEGRHGQDTGAHR